MYGILGLLLICKGVPFIKRPKVPDRGGEWVKVLTKVMLFVLLTEDTTFEMLVYGRSVGGRYLLNVIVY